MLRHPWPQTWLPVQARLLDGRFHRQLGPSFADGRLEKAHSGGWRDPLPPPEGIRGRALNGGQNPVTFGDSAVKAESCVTHGIGKNSPVNLFDFELVTR